MPVRPQIIFDVVTKTVAIVFGDEILTLHGPFPTRTAAMAAAMDECAIRGWLGGSADEAALAAKAKS
ncbi:MAG: hypothetical protein ACT6U0_20780 [Shinella sp.]|uniref:hypothetical protein n=1 Tax=Shinella sp. TaxID=1870904 RepID=UPI0040355432